MPLWKMARENIILSRIYVPTAAAAPMPVPNGRPEEHKENSMKDRKVWTIFYGSYMNLDVLKEVDLVPEHYEVARLDGFDIRIAPLANLVRSEKHCVYGIVATATHGELKRLYAHAEHVLGGVYLPEAVLVQTLDLTWRPTLCYIAPLMNPSSASDDYIDRIITPAREYGFPEWYIERLDSFRS